MSSVWFRRIASPTAAPSPNAGALDTPTRFVVPNNNPDNETKANSAGNNKGKPPSVAATTTLPGPANEETTPAAEPQHDGADAVQHDDDTGATDIDGRLMAGSSATPRR